MAASEDFTVVVENPSDVSGTIVAIEGVRGPTGPQGPIGETGPQGIQGVQGMVGPVGPVGPQGIQGDQGIQGIQGDQGIQGIQGDQGIQGEQGIKGDQGIQGPQGEQGIQGVQGPQGDQGIQGIQGEQGLQGDEGLGFKIAKFYDTLADLMADTTPTGILVGEFAIVMTVDPVDVDNGKLYIWTGSAYEYTTDMSVQGIQGPIGATGATGAQGPQGVEGPQGVQGIQGPPGPIAGTDTQVIYNDGGSSAGAAGLVYKKATGNVGIGTNAPTASLEIKTPDSVYASKGFKVTDSGGNSIITTTNDSRVFIGADIGSDACFAVINRATGNTHSLLASFKDLAQTGTPELNFYAASNQITYALTGTTGVLNFGNSGLHAAQFTIDTALGVGYTLNLKQGNVGIGTDAPVAKLTIHSSDATNNNGIAISNTQSVGNVWKIWEGTGGNYDGYLKFGLNPTTANDWKMVLDTTGNLIVPYGISTSNLRTSVLGLGDIAVLGWVGTGSNYNGTVRVGMEHPYGDHGVDVILSPATGHPANVSGTAFRVIDQSLSTEYFKVNNLGNVGIGVASPTAQLHLVKADSSALTDFLINPTVKSSGNLIDAQVGGVSKFKVSNTGDVYANSFGTSVYSQYQGVGSAALIVATTYIGSDLLQIQNTAAISWAGPVGGVTGTPDAGFARISPAYIRVTDGSTGYGSIVSSGFILSASAGGEVQGRDINNDTTFRLYGSGGGGAILGKDATIVWRDNHDANNGSADFSLSRIAPGIVGAGTGAAGSTDGLVKAASFIEAIVNKTADYTATAVDSVITVDATSAAVTITLPTAVGISGRKYTVKKVDSSVNTVVIDGDGTETIDGNLTLVVGTQWTSITVISDGSNWLVV